MGWGSSTGEGWPTAVWAVASAHPGRPPGLSQGSILEVFGEVSCQRLGWKAIFFKQNFIFLVMKMTDTNCKTLNKGEKIMFPHAQCPELPPGGVVIIPAHLSPLTHSHPCLLPSGASPLAEDSGLHRRAWETWNCCLPPQAAPVCPPSLLLSTWRQRLPAVTPASAWACPVLLWDQAAVPTPSGLLHFPL